MANCVYALTHSLGRARAHKSNIYNEKCRKSFAQFLQQHEQATLRSSRRQTTATMVGRRRDARQSILFFAPQRAHTHTHNQYRRRHGRRSGQHTNILACARAHTLDSNVRLGAECLFANSNQKYLQLVVRSRVSVYVRMCVCACVGVYKSSPRSNTNNYHGSQSVANRRIHTHTHST